MTRRTLSLGDQASGIKTAVDYLRSLRVAGRVMVWSFAGKGKPVEPEVGAR